MVIAICINAQKANETEWLISAGALLYRSLGGIGREKKKRGVKMIHL